MTDKEKLDKLVAEIERRLLPTVRDKHYDEWEEGGNNALINILSFYNSMQEEPKKCIYTKDHYTDNDRKILCEGCEEECEYNKKQPSIPDIVDEHFYEMLGEETASEDNNLRKASEKYLKVLSETPYNNTPITNAQTIVRELITFLDNPSKYNPNHIEEPVSEDTWEASKQYALRQVLASTDTEMSEQEYLNLRLFSGFELAVAHKDGVNWQKEQIIKKAFPAEIGRQRSDYKCMLHGNFCRYNTGDKVKIVIIKESKQNGRNRIIS